MAHPEGTNDPRFEVWTRLAVLAIAVGMSSLAVVARMNPDVIKEYTQSVLAILFVVGVGYLQVEQPTIDHSVIWAIVGTIVGFYFGSKVGEGTKGP